MYEFFDMDGYRRGRLPEEFEPLEELTYFIAGVQDRLDLISIQLPIPKEYSKNVRDALDGAIGSMDDLEAAIQRHIEWIQAMDSPGFDLYCEEERPAPKPPDSTL